MVASSPVFYFPATPELPLPSGHRFPAGKYRLLREALQRDAVLPEDSLRPSPLASVAELTQAHDPAYVHAILDGTIDAEIMRRIGLPWSETLTRRSRSTVGGTLAAARVALATGIAGQLAGGTHHAHHAFGSGYCTFNDFAVAARILLGAGSCDRIAVLDLDVHQGDGNAALLAGEPNVLVVSVHGEKNFPFRKVASDLDFPLPDGTEDRAYLDTVVDALDAIGEFRPDLILYNSGVDGLAVDKLGRLSLSLEGLADRDALVFQFARRRGIAIVIAIGGGYADPITQSVAAYANTFVAAKSVFGF